MNIVQDGSLVELVARLKEEGKSLSLRDILTIFLQVCCLSLAGVQL